MKKWTLAAAALSAIMCLGHTNMSAMAATGWVQEGNDWAYYNSLGDRVTDAWRRDSNGYWRYLNSSGVMAVDCWVDNDDYYVDSNGIMVSNKWLKIENAESETGYDFYFLSQSGKRVQDKWQKINNNNYYFNDEGVMQTGWILDDRYYCGTDGIMATGWQRVEPPEESDDELDYGSCEEDDGKHWYYFGSNGKKVLPDEDGENLRQKKINGVYYCLAEDGAMMTGWVCVTGDNSDSIEDYRFADANGQVRIGWYSVEPPANLASHYDHDVEWFYFSNKGVPKVGPAVGSATYKDLERIDGNTYLFNEYGVPVYGIQRIYTGSDGDEYTAYYFGTREQSCMLKGQQTVYDGSENCRYYFTSTGRGYTGVHDNYLYYMGKLQKADAASRYEVFSIPEGNGHRNYVVNASGRISKGTTVKDSSGVKYKTNSSGTLIEEDGESVDNSSNYQSPEEPDWSVWQN